MKSLREFKNAIQRREFLEQELQKDLSFINHLPFNEEEVTGKNIENLIGTTQIPLGVAGPLDINTEIEIIKDCFIPLATSEGALVASISRGCKAITKSGGATVFMEKVGITRGSVMETSGLKQSFEVKSWLELNLAKLDPIAKSVSSHIQLLKVDPVIIGRRLFIRFYFDPQDAMGMNMATIASERINKFIEQQTGVKMLAVGGNYDIDKKAGWLNFINGRGRKVSAEVVLKKQVVKEVLKTTPEKICQVVISKNLIGSAISGSMGFNAHYANIVAAIFAATGQDLAHTVEGSLGITTAEVLENGDLYLAIYLPSLIIGTVGGGTGLPAQQTALSILDVVGSGKSDRFAMIIGGAVLAGELSLLASHSDGSLGDSHSKFGRKGKDLN